MTTNAKTSCGAIIKYDYESKQAPCGSVSPGGVMLQCGDCWKADAAAAKQANASVSEADIAVDAAIQHNR